MAGRGKETVGTESVVDRAAVLIRERSAAAELMSGAELLDLLAAANLVGPDAGEPGENGKIGAIMITRLMEANADLRKITEGDSSLANAPGYSSVPITGSGPPYYYSSLYLTETYARLLVHKRAGPRQLIAAAVRDYSDAHQRPLTLDLFTQPPFLFTEEEIRVYLARMAQTAGFEDIAAIAASAGGIYLYSKRFLDQDHAVMLAEWLDAGQAANP